MTERGREPLDTEGPTVSNLPEHRVTIRLRYTEYGTPWKWQGTCGCGWRCLSWYWSDGERGALPMSREHVAWMDANGGGRRGEGGAAHGHGQRYCPNFGHDYQACSLQLDTTTSGGYRAMNPVVVIVEVNGTIPAPEVPRIVLDGAREALQAIDPDTHIHVIQTH